MGCFFALSEDLALFRIWEPAFLRDLSSKIGFPAVEYRVFVCSPYLKIRFWGSFVEFIFRLSWGNCFKEGQGKTRIPKNYCVNSEWQ